QFMRPELLQESFFTTLQEFPILAGRLYMETGGINAKIVVDRSAINMPEYCEVNSKVHFDELETARFSWDALPKELEQPGYVMRKGKDGILKLASVQIARLDGNSGLVLLVSFAHVVVDTSGVVAFLNRWAHLFQVNERGNSDSASTISTESFWHGRECLYDSLPDEGEPLDHATSEINETKSKISALFAEMTPETRSKMMLAIITFFPAQSHIFRLSSRKLSALKNDILALKTSDGYAISDNDVITALLYMVVLQCNKGHGSIAPDETEPSRSCCWPKSPKNSNKDEQRLVTIAVDCRYRLGKPDLAKFTGNGILSHILAFPLENIRAEIDPMSLAKCALQVRQGINRISPKYVRQFIDIGDSAPDCFQRLMANMMHVPTRFCVSSQSRMNFYGVDFGNGRPMWVSPPKMYVPGYASILPVPDSSGDRLVFLSVKKDIMAKVFCHPYWNSIAELVY
ncbi:hypothetical protein EV175_002514, partial [Coemansia sp. RSA 1933]